MFCHSYFKIFFIERNKHTHITEKADTYSAGVKHIYLVPISEATLILNMEFV